VYRGVARTFSDLHAIVTTFETAEAIKLRTTR
jgi:hypothetical protein